MEQTTPGKEGLRERLVWVLVYASVFATGAAGLIYEVTWQRYLARLMGSDLTATAVIMGVFLGGLSLGYFLSGRLSARPLNLLKTYALIEALIGLWGFAFPSLFSGVEALTRSLGFEPPLLMIVQGVLTAVCLIGAPTVCMGATVPLLTRGISQDLGKSTRVHARLYGVNTAGAFAGTLAAGFVLIPVLGLPLTVLFAATINMIAAAVFFFLARFSTFGRSQAFSPESAHDGQAAPSLAPRFGIFSPHVALCAIAFVSGFYVMTFENVLMRLAGFSLGSASYTFSMVLAVFLLAIAFGSLVVSRLQVLSPRALFANQLGLALSLLLVYATLDVWPYAAHLLRIAFAPNAMGFYLFYAAAFSTLVLLLVVPLSFAGATVPIVFHEIKQQLALVGRHSGLVLAWNTIGSLAGSLIGGIALFAIADTPQVFCIAVALAALSAGIASLRMGALARASAAALLVLSIAFVIWTPLFDGARFTLGTFRDATPRSSSFAGAKAFFSEFNKAFRPIWAEDGPTAMVRVIASDSPQGTAEVLGFDSLAILVNGKSDSDTVFDIFTTRLSAHLAALFAENLDRALVIGAGTGVTAGELLRYERLSQLDVAEISPEVLRALPLFRRASQGLDKDRRVRFELGDAFRVIGRSERKWDLIVSERSNRWVTGIDLLYTAEFYEMVKQHLSPGGAFVQWVHIYDANEEMIGMAVNTLCRHFPDLHVFVGEGSDLLLLARSDPLDKVALARAEQRFMASGAVRKSLGELGIRSFDGLLLRELWSGSFACAAFRERGLQTLDNPRLHYVAGRAFFEHQILELEKLYTANTAYRASDYLLARKYPQWPQKAWSKDAFEAAKAAGRYAITNSRDILHMHHWLSLQAYLVDPVAFPLNAAERELFLPTLVAIEGALPSDRDPLWTAAGLSNASLRRKAEVLLHHVSRARRWVAPYSIRGLEQLLGRGAKESETAASRNWFVLSLARIQVEQRLSRQTLFALLSQLERAQDGKLAIAAKDLGLYHQLRSDLLRSGLSDLLPALPTP